MPDLTATRIWGIRGELATSGLMVLADNIAKVAAVRRAADPGLLRLRDGQIRCLPEPAQAA